jgi:hypothetical protein
MGLGKTKWIPLCSPTRALPFTVDGGVLASHQEAVVAVARPGASIDEIRIEETVQYKAKMGRWRRIVLAVTQRPFFWCLIPLMQLALDPLQHLVSSVHKQMKRAEGCGTSLCGLVTGRTQSFLTEYVSIFQNASSWVPEYMESCLLTKLDDCVALAVEVMLHAAASFYRRFLLLLDKFLT